MTAKYILSNHKGNGTRAFTRSKRLTFINESKNFLSIHESIAKILEELKPKGDEGDSSGSDTTEDTDADKNSDNTEGEDTNKDSDEPGGFDMDMDSLFGDIDGSGDDKDNKDETETTDKKEPESKEEPEEKPEEKNLNDESTKDNEEKK